MSNISFVFWSMEFQEKILLIFTDLYPKIRLRCLLRVKGLAICFYLAWSGSILQFRQNIINVGSKSWLLTCSSNITLSLPSYTGSALKRELNFCLLYFWSPTWTHNQNSASQSHYSLDYSATICNRQQIFCSTYVFLLKFHIKESIDQTWAH